MGAEAGGWDWWLGLLAVAGSIAAVVQVLQHYADPPERVEGWVERDPEFRAELAGRLRGAKVGSIYRDRLTKGLNWLDRHWGERGSARAFGVCIIIALCYTYAAFFLAWGVGGPGYIGGTRLADGSIEGEIGLLGDADQPVRGLLALWLVAAPALGFVFGRWLGRQERRLKARLRRRYRWRRRRFEIGYRAVLVVIFVSAVAALAAIDERLASGAGLFALLAAAPIAGIAAARRSRRDFSAGLLAAGAGAGAGTGAFAVGLALAVAFAITFAGDEAGAVTVAVAVAGAVGVAFAITFAGGVAGAVGVAGAGAVAGAVTFAEAYAVAVPYPVAGAAGAFVTTFVAVAVPVAGASAAAVGVAGAGGVGAATAHRGHRGAFAGGLGAIVAFGLIATGVGAGAAGESAVVLLVFLFVLPVINGFWDWLSWWITRLLGRHLLATLAPARALGGRAVTILWHGILDLVLSAALLAAMAFLLAFCFETYNQLAEAQGQRAFDLGPYLQAAADRPWTDGLWLTVMLLSTLVPTALHVVALLASPLAMIMLPTEKRLALAGDLETWDEQPERYASIQRRSGQYFARERHGAIAIAAGLFVLLTGGLLALINLGLGMLEPGQSVAHLVLGIAEAGRATADALAATLGI